MNSPKVGVVGLGIMGSPMAVNLSKAGYCLNLYDIDSAAVERTARKIGNATVMSSPKALAQVSNVVITMLPSGEYVHSVTTGTDGLMEGFQKGALFIDTSSSEPWITLSLAKQLRKQGVQLIDAPVSGAQIGAQKAELVFMVGGDVKAVNNVMPVFKAMGKQVFHLGPVGAGHIMKCINNLITSVTFMATVEGMTIGKHYGLDPEVMTDVLNVSTGMSWISQTHIRQRIISRKFDDPFKLQLMIKDIGIAMAMAHKSGLPVPISGLGQQLWRAAGLFNEKDSSISDMVRWMEQLSKVEISPVNETLKDPNAKKGVWPSLFTLDD